MSENNDPTGNPPPLNNIPLPTPLSFFWGNHQSSRIYLFSRLRHLSSEGTQSSESAESAESAGQGEGSERSENGDTLNASAGAESNDPAATINGSGRTILPPFESLINLSPQRLSSFTNRNTPSATPSTRNQSSSSADSASDNVRIHDVDPLNPSHLYLTEAIIFNHICHRDKSITAKRFKEFSTLSSPEELGNMDNCCSICYDQFLFDSPKEKEQVNDLGKNSRKRSAAHLDHNEGSKRKKLNTTSGATSNSLNAISSSTASSTIESPDNLTTSGVTEDIEQQTVNPAQLHTQQPVNPQDDDAEKEALANAPHNATQLPCGHVFGTNCLFQWLKSSNTCPYCRAKVEDPYKPRQKQFIIKRLQNTSSSQFIRELFMELTRM